jgi:hypothetical protein
VEVKIVRGGQIQEQIKPMESGTLKETAKNFIAFSFYFPSRKSSGRPCKRKG